MGPTNRLFWILRIAVAMCFIGHGAFGLITKASWLPYFAAVGIGRDLGYSLMPLIGIVDILLGLSMLIRPTRAALAYMTFWAVWTALLRPLAGQGVSEFLERAGNYGVPFALFGLSSLSVTKGGWFETLRPRPHHESDMKRAAWVLRATTALLLFGHGVLAVTGKPLLAKHLVAVGLGRDVASVAGLVTGQGWLEISLAAAVLIVPAWPLLLAVFVWKVATELLFPITGDYIWEFVERGGSYGAPLGAMVLRLLIITRPDSGPLEAAARSV